MSKRLYIATLFLLMPVALAFAQPADTYKALVKQNNNELDSAMFYIDRSVVNDGKEDAQTWMIRGFIYKAVYKEREKGNRESKARSTSVESYLRSLELDTAKEFADQSRNGLSFLSNTYYNDAALSVNVDEYESSQVAYKRYKEIAKFLDPNKRFDAEDVKYYSVLGSSVFSVLYDRGGPDAEKYRDLALECYHKVLQIDSNQFGANYNIGVLYYNMGVQIMTNIPEDTPIPEIDSYQEKALDLFAISEPSLLRAYSINPYRREIYIALAGIYFARGDMTKHKIWIDKLRALDKLLEEQPELNQALRDFNETVADINKFVQDNGRLPSLSTENFAEKSMAKWMERVRVDKTNGHLPNSSIEKLEAIPGWTWD